MDRSVHRDQETMGCICLSGLEETPHIYFDCQETLYSVLGSIEMDTIDVRH